MTMMKNTLKSILLDPQIAEPGQAKRQQAFLVITMVVIAAAIFAYHAYHGGG
jgi:hypothetical protein